MLITNDRVRINGKKSPRLSWSFNIHFIQNGFEWKYKGLYFSIKNITDEFTKQCYIIHCYLIPANLQV